MTGVELIAQERQRQIDVEGFGREHDMAETDVALASAAVAYIVTEIDEGEAKAWWPWGLEWYKPGDVKRNLVKAGALIAAAIDRLQIEEETI